MSLLELSGVGKNFGGLRAVDGVDLTVEAGSITGMIGPNGSGKTTLFNLITGFYRVSAGTIHFDERDIHRLSIHRIAQLGLLRTFQKTTVFPELSALENVRIGMFAQTRANVWSSLLRTPGQRKERAQAAERAREILEFMGLSAVMDTAAKQLPFGMLRHLGIAIALAGQPRLLLMDEPAAGLNPEETHALSESLQRIREQGITILLVEHDMKLVMGICERIIVVNEGHKIAEGTPEEVSRNPDVVRVYLGEDLDL